jgi:hypothetical protein
MIESPELYLVTGDGGEVRLTKGLFSRLAEEAEECSGGSGRETNRHHLEAHDTRFCIWDGQSADGRKWAANTGGKVRPFDGACDTRVGLVDLQVQEDVALSVMSLLMADVVVQGMEGDDERLAANANLYLRWVLDNELGFSWLNETVKLAQYVYGDSPGVGMMRVVWRRRMGLRLQKVTGAELVGMYLKRVGMDPEGDGEAGEAARVAANELLGAIEAKAVDGVLLGETLREFFPSITEKRALRAAQELLRDGVCEFPVEVVTKDGPEVEARRLNEHWFVPKNTRDPQEARAWFEPERLDRVGVEEAAREEGWSAAFKEAVLKSEGAAKFLTYTRGTDGTLAEVKDDLKGLCEVVRVQFRAATDEGVVGVYETTMSLTAGEKGYGYEPRLVDYPHGHYTGHAMQREALNDRLLDSRGWADVLGTHQELFKLFLDAAGNHAQVAPLPPLKTRGRRTQGALHMRALGEIALGADGDAEWLAPPAFPATVVKMMEELRRQVDEAGGRENADGSKELTGLKRRFKVVWFLGNMREVLRQLLQLGQAYETPERLARVVNDDGDAPLGSREDMAGQFDLRLMFDPGDLDGEKVAAKAEAIGKILLPLDRRGTVDTVPLVKGLLRRMAPDLAAASLRGSERARDDEVQDEWKRYVEILGGKVPERRPDGSEDYAARAEMYNELLAANPAAFDWLPADRRKILQEHLQYLQVQAEQYGKNRQIGREGARRTGGKGEGGRGERRTSNAER